MRKENEELKQSYQYSRSIMEVRVTELEETIVQLKAEKKMLEDRLSNITSANEINSLKLISKV